MASPTKLYAGIDVSKGHLEVAVRPAGERFGVPNDDAGIDVAQVCLSSCYRIGRRPARLRSGLKWRLRYSRG
jgi:hypothetical protein